MARHNDDDTPPAKVTSPARANVAHGALRYVRSQRHLNGQDRTGARGGRDDVAAFEQDTWRGRDQRMREMHSGGSGPSQNASGTGSGRSDRSDNVSEPSQNGPKRSRDDQRVRDEVNELLTVHDHVDASEIEVDVKEGVVTLSGTVSSRGERREAEDALYGIEGVEGVINQLRVVPRDIAAPFER